MIGLRPGKNRHANLAALVLINFLWAAQYPAYKVAGNYMSVSMLNFWSFVFAILLLLPFLIRQRRRAAAVPDFVAERQSPDRGNSRTSNAWQFVLVGVVGILPPSVMISAGIARSTASNAAIFSLTIPLLMTLLGVAMLGEKMTRLRLVSLMLALVGTLFASRGDFRGDLISLRMLAGNAMIILAGFGSAFYNAYSKKLLMRYSEVEVLIYGYIVASIGCAILATILDPRPLYDVTGYPFAAWLAVAVLAVFPWGIAMFLWMWVLKRMEASQVAVSIYLLSIFGVLLSALALHERPNASQIGGGILVFASTYLVSDYEARRSRKSTAAP